MTLKKVNRVLGEMIKEVGGEAVLSEGINDKYLFKAIFAAGGPASGKSFVTGQVAEGMGVKFLNSDIAFEKFMAQDPATFMEPGTKKFKELDFDWEKPEMDSPLAAAQRAEREKSQRVLKSQKVAYIEGMLPVLYDGTADDPDKILKRMAALKSQGYDVGMVFVNTSLAVAQERNRMRARSLKPDVLEEIWNKAQAAKDIYKSKLGSDFLEIQNDKVLEKTDMMEFGKKMRSWGMKWFGAPLKNPIGVAKLEKIRSVGGKSQKDLGAGYVPYKESISDKLKRMVMESREVSK